MRGEFVRNEHLHRICRRSVMFCWRIPLPPTIQARQGRGSEVQTYLIMMSLPVTSESRST